LNGVIQSRKTLDAAFMSSATFVTLTDFVIPRVIFAPVANISRDYDDVRRFADAATEGIKRALSAGAQVRSFFCFVICLQFRLLPSISFRVSWRLLAMVWLPSIQCVVLILFRVT
jgi:hypothetical protein